MAAASPEQDATSDPNAPARILALDVGDRRIGIALSDALGYTAQPLFTLTRSTERADVKSIARLIRKYGVHEVVVGNPLHLSGDMSPQAVKAQKFAEALQAATKVTLHLWDERLSTTEANRHLDELGHSRGAGADGRGRRGIIDQVAAVLVLQAFLAGRQAASAP